MASLRRNVPGTARIEAPDRLLSPSGAPAGPISATTSAHRHGSHDVGHDAHRVMTGQPVSAPEVIVLSPSLLRMGVGGRLAIAALLSGCAWAATLAVLA
jgi:hypothetical protein